MKKALLTFLVCIYFVLSIINFVLIKKFFDIMQYIPLTIIIAEWALVTTLVIICSILILKGDFDD